MTEKKKKVLAFNQNDKFYFQRAMRLIDNMDFARGIKMLNAAIEQKPENIEYRMNLCDVLTDIGYYTKSIDEILKVMVMGKDIDPKCYYMLGFNYYELGEYIKALNMFERFLSLEPLGELSDEVYFFLENIEDFTMTSWQEFSMFPSHIYSTKSDITNIDETRMSDDIDVWAREQNIKALMAYSKKEYLEATKICKNVLNKLPNRNGVLCTLALSLYKEGKKAEGIFIAQKLTESVASTMEDLFRVSFVLCELNMDNEAKDVLTKLKKLMPFSEKVNHYLAIAYFNTGDFENAKKLWNTCYEINSDSYKYEWYIENIDNQLVKKLEYSDYLPTVALIENIRYLEKTMEANEDKSNEICWNDKKFKKIVLGSLEKCSEEIQLKLLNIIFSYAGDERESIFRRLLLNDYIKEQNKNEILSLLHRIDAKEPFLMMTDYQLVDVAINVISVDNNSKDDFVKVLNYALNNICRNKEEKEMVVALWSSAAVKFMVANKKVRKINLWAMGFYYASVMDLITDDELKKMLNEHEITKRSLLTIANMIIEEKGE